MKKIIITIILLGLLSGCVTSDLCEEKEIKEWILNKYPNATGIDIYSGPRELQKWYDVRFHAGECKYEYDFHLDGRIELGKRRTDCCISDCTIGRWNPPKHESHESWVDEPDIKTNLENSPLCENPFPWSNGTIYSIISNVASTQYSNGTCIIQVWNGTEFRVRHSLSGS